MKYIDTERVIIKSWCNDPEDGAIEQAKNLANLPFIFKQVVLLSDVHKGYGMPIGGVIATKGVIIPNAVGVDIGCGMCAAKTSIHSDDLQIEVLKNIMGAIRHQIPVGRNHHKKPQDWDGFYSAPEIPIIQQEINSAQYQIGTLGGGNHFIEIQKADDGMVWVMIHSGSRNFGYKIAKHYNKVAQELCQKWYSNIPPIKGEDGLAFLPLDTIEGQEYFEAMIFACEFSYANRRRMLKRIEEIIQNITSEDMGNHINIHHNYARMENHFGQNVMVHRKGATSAREGEPGIIPGSQGTSSYIVEGLGNPESFTSCSHGAGRKMSRMQARKELNLMAEQDMLNAQGILHTIRGIDDLDEASGAYKDIITVMEEQKDLVEIETRLEPLAVIKG